MKKRTFRLESGPIEQAFANFDFSDATTVSHLSILQETEEVPEKTFLNTFALNPVIERFPALEHLRIEAHIFCGDLSHPTVLDVELSGAVTLANFDFPSCRTLKLSIMGDAHGVATSFEKFDGLLSNETLGALRSVDLRGLDLEIMDKRKLSCMERWGQAVWLPHIQTLGLPGEGLRVGALKKTQLFSHLDALVVSGLLSAFEKNPVGKNIYFEDSMPEVPLNAIPRAIQALPKLSDVIPTLNDTELIAMLTLIENEAFRIEQSKILARLLIAFVKKKQWERMERLLQFARKKARTMRVFLDVLLTLEIEVQKIMAKSPDDRAGRTFLDFLVKKNAL